EHIELRGVHTHNLKGIDCRIPQGKLTVVTGLSGSGKSSLAFDTLYAEGQRRYTESLSTYARQFLQQLERPPVDFVKNLQPAVALRQHNEVQNARSTVGTVTEIDDHMHLLFTHIGEVTCVNCGTEVKRDTLTSALDEVLAMEDGKKLVIVAMIDASNEELRPSILKQLVQEGHRRLLVEGELLELDDADAIDAVLGMEVFPLVIDRVVVREDQKMRVSEALEAGFSMGKGRVVLFEHRASEPMQVFDRAFRCNTCGTDAIEPQPALFSFNSSLGACPLCTGFGKTVGLDFKKVIPNPNRTLEGGAIVCFETTKYKSYRDKMLRACRAEGIPVNLPFRKLVKEHQRFVKEGGKKWKGVRGFFKVLQGKQHKTHVRIYLARYRGYDDCSECLGARLGPHARNVRVHGRSVSDFWDMRLEEMLHEIEHLALTPEEEDRVGVLRDEVLHRLRYLTTVGLGYLTLGRQSRTLSGGEMQRIHLTTSLGRALTDTLYVLDEPTAGLHAIDSTKLLKTLWRLRDLGNTVVVVEHDPDIILGADHIIEVGPLSGEHGGELVFEGPFKEFLKGDTLTARALEERVVEARVMEPLPEDHPHIEIIEAREHNLDDITVRFPCERLTAISGVSGSGKSTLLHRTLYNGWRRLKGQGGVEAGAVEALRGLDRFDTVVMMSQSSLGRSSRSNALSYTKGYDDVRKLFAATAMAKKEGLTMGDFSFNTPGGRCENCQGAGTITIEMHFMADIDIVCPECQGKRFTDRVLGVEYRGKNIDDVLSMTVDEALEFFAQSKPLIRKLSPLGEVGLGYLRLGQSTPTLSGGEAQRLKLATYIAQGSKRGDIDPVLFIFDEPTVGLHLRDVDVLLDALRKLVELGHTVLVIEHNTDFIAQCDWIIELGPGAGPRGGQLVAAGTPEQIA
ncbi:unnamed protein product, partial [Laminaria digitata]